MDGVKEDTQKAGVKEEDAKDRDMVRLRQVIWCAHT